MSVEERFAQVIIPLAVEGTFTYAVPESLRDQVSPGCRVLVPFGKKRIYSAVVHSLTTSAPAGFTPKRITEVLDQTPYILEHQLQLWDWMASYYMCNLGEVMRAALPSGLRPESESKVRVSAGYRDDGTLDGHERLLLEVVKDQGEVTMGELEMTGISERPLKVLKQLVDKGAVEINEFVRTLIRKRTSSYIRLSGSREGENAIHDILDNLARAPKQKALMERYLHMSGIEGTDQAIPVMKHLLIEGAGDPGALSALLKKGILQLEEREEMNKEESPDPESLRKPFKLNREQDQALREIRTLFLQQQSVLLHGVTSSGKTELYIHLVLNSWNRVNRSFTCCQRSPLPPRSSSASGGYSGRGWVYFIPASAIHKGFMFTGTCWGYTDEEPYGVVIGVRSAIFLPFRDLGLVIIDEEHENTYKQHDPAPRYHARDSAQVLALFQGARVLMGTATPSFESLHNARTGKYGLVSIHGRFGDVEKPEIILANTREATHRKQMVSHFTPLLLEGIRECTGGRGAGDPVPEPTGIFPLHRLQRLRGDSKMPPV